MLQSIMEGNFKSVEVGVIPHSLRSKSPRSTQATHPFLSDCFCFPDGYKPKIEDPNIERVSSERDKTNFTKVSLAMTFIPEVLAFVEP